MGNIIYLDNNATTPCAPEVLDAMLPFFSASYANPASPHVMGRKAAQSIEKARCQVATCIQCDPLEVIFTSGATESNNLAILGLSRVPESNRRRVLVGATEHKSVLAPVGFLRGSGFNVEYVPVDATGSIRLDVLHEMIRPDVLLVSAQAANNEIGTIQPVREIAELAHSVGALMHCDAAQALGKIDFRLTELNVDCASMSGHKSYGPKGVGVLYAKHGLLGRKLLPILGGGGHERGIRPGTLNVPGIVAMGVVCELAQSRLGLDAIRIRSLRDRLEERLLQAVPGSRINGNLSSRLPGTTNIVIPGIPADVLLANVSDVCFSDGSACTSGAVAPSHVLLAMGVSKEDAECSIRLSLGRFTTEDDIDLAVTRLVIALQSLGTEMQRNGHTLPA